MGIIMFGAGVIWATPLQDALGNPVVNGTPVQFATAQEIGVDTSFEGKMLYGSNQYPEDVARGKGKIGVKVKAARVNGLLLSSIIYGQALISGTDNYVYDVQGSVVGAGGTVTVVPPAGAYAADCGVRGADGRPYIKVASAPSVRQYSVTAGGVYTFAAAEAGNTVFVSYRYVDGANTTSTRINVRNVLMGAAPFVQLDMFWTKDGRHNSLRFPRALAGKFGMQSKLDDYMIPEMDFDVFSDPLGNVMYQSLGA
jgi:hypothetical protein